MFVRRFCSFRCVFVFLLRVDAFVVFGRCFVRFVVFWSRFLVRVEGFVRGSFVLRFVFRVRFFGACV